MDNNAKGNVNKNKSECINNKDQNLKNYKHILTCKAFNKWPFRSCSSNEESVAQQLCYRQQTGFTSNHIILKCKRIKMGKRYIFTSKRRHKILISIWDNFWDDLLSSKQYWLRLSRSTDKQDLASLTYIIALPSPFSNERIISCQKKSQSTFIPSIIIYMCKRIMVRTWNTTSISPWIDTIW